MREPLVIWGAGGHARVVAEVVRCEGRYELVGFLDSLKPERQGTEFAGLRVLGGTESLPDLVADGVRYLVVAVGNCSARLALAQEAARYGFQLATSVHPRATVAHGVSIGDGTVVMAGAVINPGTVVGGSVIVNTSASIDHDCTIGEGVHISPGAHLAGAVRVGRASWIGIGSIVIDNVSIGESVVIGAGGVVVNDMPDRVLAYGVPARIVRDLSPHAHG